MQLCKGEDPKSCDESANIIECRAFMDDTEGYLRDYFNIKKAKGKWKASAWHRQREVYANNLVEEVSISGTSLFFVYLGIFFLPLFCVCAVIAYCTGAVRCNLRHWVKGIRRHRQQRQQQRHQHQQPLLRPNRSNTSVVVDCAVIDYHTTETAQVNTEVAPSVPSAPPNTTQRQSAPPPDVTTSHSHPNLEVTSSLPNYEDIVPPQRRSITPDPQMLLPSYDEARLMESGSYQEFRLTSTNGPILQLLTAQAPEPPTTTQQPSAPPPDIVASHSHPNLEVTSSLHEDVVLPQRGSVTPEPYMLLPTYDEARLME